MKLRKHLSQVVLLFAAVAVAAVSTISTFTAHEDTFAAACNSAVFNRFVINTDGTQGVPVVQTDRTTAPYSWFTVGNTGAGAYGSGYIVTGFNTSWDSGKYITVTYPRGAVYDGKYIDVTIKYRDYAVRRVDISRALFINQDLWRGVVYGDFDGTSFVNAGGVNDSIYTDWELRDSATGELVNVLDSSYLSFFSLNAGEFVAPLAGTPGTGFGSASSVVGYSGDLFGRSGYVGTSNDGWEDSLGGYNFVRSGISLPLNNAQFTIFMGINQPRDWVWNAFSTALTIGDPCPAAPTKQATELTFVGTDEPIEFVLSQRVQDLWTEITNKYDSLVLTDTIDPRVSINPSQVRVKLNNTDYTGSFNVSFNNHVLTVTASSALLANVDLLYGATIHVVIPATITSEDNAPVINLVNSTIDGRMVPSNETTTELVYRPTVTIAKTDHVDEALPGQTLDYEVTVTNNTKQEPSVAIKNAIVTDTVPEGLSVVADSISDDGVYDEVARTITWLLDSLEVGDHRTYTFSAIIDPDISDGTKLDNTVTVAPNPDADDPDATPFEVSDPRLCEYADSICEAQDPTLVKILRVPTTGATSATDSSSSVLADVFLVSGTITLLGSSFILTRKLFRR
jgi:fimbrial isopeptide formation D2 family protein/uncharacterized repeat protein (TIGR01451 family)